MSQRRTIRYINVGISFEMKVLPISISNFLSTLQSGVSTTFRTTSFQRCMSVVSADIFGILGKLPFVDKKYLV